MGKLIFIIWEDPKCNHKCTYKHEAEGDQTEEKVVWPQGRRLEWCAHKPMNASGHQKWEEARGGFSRRASGGRLTALILAQWFWCWTSCLQNCGRVYGGCRKWLCGDLLQQLWKTNTDMGGIVGSLLLCVLLYSVWIWAIHKMTGRLCNHLAFILETSTTPSILKQ